MSCASPVATSALDSRTRNPGIDLLRGLSIVLVVAHHVGLRIPLAKGALGAFLPQRILNALIYNGYEAVFVFFVVSGFLITTNSLARWARLSAIHAPSFYARRAARILPCLIVLVAILSVLHLVRAQEYVISREGQSLPRAILAALGLHLNWYEGSCGYLPAGWDVLWSLSIEEVFYLGFPLVCIALRRDEILMPALALFAASLPLTRGALAANEIWQEKAYLPGMAGIAAGVLTALIASRLRPRKLVSGVLLGLGAAGLVAILFFEDLLWPHIANGAMLVLTASASALVFAFYWRARQGAARPMRGTRWLCSFGRLSYEVYLTHMFVVWPVVHAFKAAGADIRWGFLWYVPAISGSWLLGWLVSKLLSVPCERALRRRWLKDERAQGELAGAIAGRGAA